MLPNAALKPAYDQAVWLYVYRDFSGKGADIEADRVSLRLGVTSWPQLLLVDPNTVRVIGTTGRTVRTFLPAVKTAKSKVKAMQSLAAVNRVKRADARAALLERRPTVEMAKRCFEDDDIVVRYRALRFLATKDADFVAERAVALLQVPNDTYRYQVCTVLGNAGKTAARGALERLVRNPAPSKNPNVLRIHAVSALATCGGPQSIQVIQPFTRGSHLNGLTRRAIDSVAAIGARHPKTKSQVHRILIDAFPRPVTKTPIDARYSTIVARAVHSALEKVTGAKQAFPKTYDRASRQKLVEAWANHQ